MATRGIKNQLNDSFWMAIDAIRKNKLRSTLTLLGISIGVFSVISVMTALRTLESAVSTGLNVFATNTFIIQKDPNFFIGSSREEKDQYRNRKNITIDQFRALKARCDMPKIISAEIITDIQTISYKDRKVQNSVELLGGDDGTVRFYNTFLVDGRNFVIDDIHYSRNVCVLGMDIVDRLFPYENPLGKKIKIKGLDYFVIGVTERQGEAFGVSKDNFIVIPVTNFLEKFSNQSSSLSIHIETESEEIYNKTMDEVIGHLRAIRRIPPDLDNDFEVVTNLEMIERFSGFTSGIKIFALAVSVISLVVAGIGIMNIMLVSVTERIKEIGIRKAIGATKKDILVQFLMEAVFLCEFGGVVGIVLGVSGGNIVSLIFNIPAMIPVDWTIIGLLVCSFVGISFGIYPAWRAAELDPIESLRFE